MYIKPLCLVFLCCGSLCAQPGTISLQLIESKLRQALFELNQTKVELDILQEKVTKLEAKQISKPLPPTSSAALEKRLLALENGQKAATEDLKSLSKELATLSGSLQTKLKHLDQVFSSDIKSVKGSLSTMLGLLDASEMTYTVQSGDSLGGIALKHKVSLKALKQHNCLSSDTIIVGQTLKIPSNTNSRM